MNLKVTLELYLVDIVVGEKTKSLWRAMIKSTGPHCCNRMKQAIWNGPFGYGDIMGWRHFEGHPTDEEVTSYFGFVGHTITGIEYCPFCGRKIEFEVVDTEA